MKCFLFAATLWCALSPLLHAQNVAAYAVADDASGTVLSSRNGTKKLQIGSLTKVATAMVVLDWAEAGHQDLSQEAAVPASAAAITNQAGVGFLAEDRCSLRDLLYAALLQSDNAAAQTLAAHVGGALGGGEPVAAFVAQMNALAGRLGMQWTHFTNAHGLEEGERSLPYSTAEDLLKLTRYAEERAGFRFYVSQKEKKIAINRVSGPVTYLLRNTNELLGVEEIDGVKTGTTKRAGGCLIISAARPPESRQEGEKHFITPRRLNVVVLGAADRFATARGLLQEGWRFHESWIAAGRPEKWKPR